MRGLATTGVLVVASCGFGARVGEIDALHDDAGRELRTWSFDSAAELAASGHEAIGMTIDPRGSLTPHGYAYGGLLARGVAGAALWSAADTTWSKVETVTPGGTGVWSGDALATGADLRFAGVDGDPALRTLWFEGELALPAGATALRVDGDDVAFVEIAVDGAFVPVARNGTGTVTTPAAGWYPVRIGWADADGTGAIALALDVGAGFAPVRRTRLRAATSALQGTLRSVYYRQIHGGGIAGRPPVRHVQETALHEATAFAPPLPGSLTTAVTPYDWSARWAGQLYVTSPGSYTFRAQSSDGNRLLAGTAEPVATRYARNDNGTATTTSTAELVEGWNDLVLDYNDVGGAMDLAFAITAAPDAALVNAPVPRERLRPVEPRADRLITVGNVPAAPIDVPDNTNTYRFLDAVVAAYASEEVTFVEVTAVVRTQRPGDLGYRLIAPDGTTITDPPLIKNADGGQHIVHYAGTHGVGKPAGGRWRFGVVDANGGGNVTTYEELHVTIHTTGGLEQVARTASWRSPIVANATAISQIDAIAWDDRIPAGASVTVRLRTCDDAACDGDAWSEPLVKGTPPVVPPHRHVQLEVAMTSDGTREPELRSLMVQYRTAPE